MVLDDEATDAVSADEARVRIVHPAPGTEPLALAVTRANDEAETNDEAEANDEAGANDHVEFVETVAYGDASGYGVVGSGDLVEVRTEDGEAVVIDLSAQGLSSGMLHTVFITGTPVAEVPLEALVASTQPTEVDEAEPADAAAEEAEPADTAAEGAEPAAEAAEADRAEDAAEERDHAMVRLVHAAPHTAIEQIMLVTDAEAGAAADAGRVIEDFTATENGSVSDYVAVPAGTYEVNVALDAAGAEEADADAERVVPSETFDASGGEHFTIMLLGVAAPVEGAKVEQNDEAFFAWLEDLFTDDIAATVGYGEASGYVAVNADDTLVVRTPDGEATIVDMADHDLGPGMLHTIFVTGTPVEQVPMEAVVGSTQPRDAETTDDGASLERPTEVTVAATPAQPDTRAQEFGYVRFVHGAPPAEIIEIILTTDDAVSGVSLQEFVYAGYMDVTEYVAIPVGTYDIIVDTALDRMNDEEADEEAEDADAENGEANGEDADAERVETDSRVATALVRTETFTANAGAYYTLAFFGLVAQHDVAQRDEGFIDWLQGLFTDDPAAQEEFALRIMVIVDHFEQVGQDQMEVRVVHTAPGTESLALVQVHDAAANDVDVHHTVAYGEISGYSTINIADGPLEVRIEGSEVVVIDLEELEAGMVHTIYVTGTPIEEVPMDAVVLSTSWQHLETRPAN